jgi:phage FluMu gp28-like protein
MFNWKLSKDKQLQSDEYEKLLKRWVDVEQRVSRLELNESSFRDKVLRKIQKQQDETENYLSNPQQETRANSSRRRFGGRAR